MQRFKRAAMVAEPVSGLLVQLDARTTCALWKKKLTSTYHALYNATTAEFRIISGSRESDLGIDISHFSSKSISRLLEVTGKMWP